MKINLHTTDSDLTQPPLPPPSTFIPMRFARRGGKKTIIRPDEKAAQLLSHPILPNQPLLTSLARSFYWQKLLDDGVASSGSDIAKREGLDVSTVNELLRLTLLDPCIVNDIMTGNQPEDLNTSWFTRNALPVEWQEQQILIASISAY